ncbi:MAG: LysM peptidoglycan-binding domain-containing protein [Chitinophagaceae bacterium]|nr:LysM peptidoglycan-binding domain-containing protein [Chitinophagaceae bacterium]
MLKTRFFTVVLLLTISVAGMSQAKLQVHGTSPSLYVVHTVSAKENLYSIGRIYNASPKEIAPFNSTSMDKALAIGQQLRIPLNAANFSQDGKKATDELFVPVYHTVQDKEWMYRISTNYNKVPVENLQKWNGVTNDQLKSGMQVVVGYLKIKQSQSSLASMGVNKIPIATLPPTVAKEPPVVEDIARKDPPPPVTTTEQATKIEEVKPETTQESKPVEVHPVVSSTPVKGGSFKKLYSESGNGTAGNAGIFRSTSGWNDSKYYALMNNVPVGTIVKVSFSSTNKSVYAKVLGQLPEMRESQGLTIRISDAAAAELGVSLTKFYVDVKY